MTVDQIESMLDDRYTREGLNASWSVTVWPVGNGVFFTDNENGTYSLVVRDDIPQVGAEDVIIELFILNETDEGYNWIDAFTAGAMLSAMRGD